MMSGVLAFVFVSMLAAAPADDAPVAAAACVQCHRPHGVTDALPLLEGQNAEYLATQLVRFREAHREGFPMQDVAAALEPDAIAALAAHFAARPWTRHGAGLDVRRVDAGRLRASDLQCANCHLPGYMGTATIPRLAGQHPEYLARQLRAFGDGRRYHPTTGVGSRMYTLSDDDVAALSQYLASRDARPDLDWLAGHWCSADGARSTEESWSRARGGLMLGVHRDVKDDRAGFFEFLRIELEPGKAVYRAQPLGRAPPVDFPATDIDAMEVVFANPAHDFPRRIRYSRDGDVLTASVDDGAGGNVQTWHWQRDCRLP